jgi:hypothetical protein
MSTKRPASPTADEPAAKSARVESLDANEGSAATAGAFTHVFEPAIACNVTLVQGEWRIRAHRVDLLRSKAELLCAMPNDEGDIPFTPGTFATPEEFVDVIKMAIDHAGEETVFDDSPDAPIVLTVRDLIRRVQLYAHLGAPNLYKPYIKRVSTLSLGCTRGASDGGLREDEDGAVR